MPKLTESNQEYQKRMDDMLAEVSDMLDGVAVEEVALVCAKIAGFCMRELPNIKQREEIMQAVLNTMGAAAGCEFRVDYHEGYSDDAPKN